MEGFNRIMTCARHNPILDAVQSVGKPIKAMRCSFKSGGCGFRRPRLAAFRIPLVCF